MDSAVVIEIVIAIMSIIASTAISESQMKSSEGRSSRETFVRSVYQAVKDKFNISIDQLNQAAEKLGVKLSQLTEASRGSARLSIANKILREFTQKYPELVNAINDTKNVIQKEVNNLTAKEGAAASAIENRKDYSNQQILNDTVGSISNVNSALNDLNGKAGGANNNTIDTSLIQKQISNDRTESMDKAERERQSEEDKYPYGKPYGHELIEERTQPQIKKP